MKHFTMATILSAILATGLATGLATAATAHSSSVTTQQVKETAQIAVQGLNALRDVKLARIALFQGNPQKAESLTNHAATLLADDSVDWVKFVHTDKKTNLKDDKYVAIDASIGISEDYIASSEKQEVIKRANDKIKKGDSKGAIEELRLANIGVIENICLMPLKQTRKAVTEAQKLMGEHKYYEANLALKGAEDGVIMDSSAIFTN